MGVALAVSIGFMSCRWVVVGFGHIVVSHVRVCCGLFFLVGSVSYRWVIIGLVVVGYGLGVVSLLRICCWLFLVDCCRLFLVRTVGKVGGQ
jgi:hypothetical protein